MCIMKKKVRLDEPFYNGYKVVAVHRKSGKYHSVAMGFCYDKYKGRIPVIKKQHVLGYFRDDILTSDASNELMQGRTCVFKTHDGASKLSFEINVHPKNTNYDYKIKRARVSGDLMLGTYYVVGDVVGGRKIKFLN